MDVSEVTQQFGFQMPSVQETVGLMSKLAYGWGPFRSRHGWQMQHTHTSHLSHSSMSEYWIYIYNMYVLHIFIHIPCTLNGIYLIHRCITYVLCVYWYVYVHVCVCASMYTYRYTRARKTHYKYRYVCMGVYACVCMSNCIFLCACIFVYVCACMSNYIFLCAIHFHLCVCVCVFFFKLCYLFFQ